MMPDKSTQSDAPELDRSISLFQATVYGVGIILGAGIYALIGEAVGISGNSVWISFFVAALIAGCSAISYAELTSIYPRSAAEFVFVKEITGSPFLGFIVGYLTVLTGVISVAAVALGFSSYFKLYMDVNAVLVAIIVIILSSALNFSGIQQSAKVNGVFTFIEAGGLVFIIVIGIPFIGEVNLLESATHETLGSIESWKPIMAASALIFFAYIGFEDIANIAEETKSASTNVPLALLLSLLITTVIYVLVAIVSVSVVPGEALFAASKLDNPTEGPLALVASTALNSPLGGKLFTVVALCATANTVLVLQIVSSRMLFGIAREKCLPPAIAKISKKTRTPVNAIILTTILCVMFTLSGSIGDVANLTNVGVFLVFAIVNLMLLMYRYKNRYNFAKRKGSQISLAINIGWFPVLPFLGVLFCTGMLFTQFWQPMSVFGFSIPIIYYASLMTLVALPIYFFNNLYWKRML
jgi:APA family basic amino acid/polyamine antiporter